MNNRRGRSDGQTINIPSWNVACGWSHPYDAAFAQRLGEYVASLSGVEKVLKHDHRAEVGVFHFEGTPYVLKKFTLQMTWVWFQLTSICFPSLGEIACINAMELSNAGILTPRPTLLLQKRKLGMIVESWLIYPYLEGTKVGLDSAAEIVRLVRRMHEAGWIHRDPHPDNFLMTPDGLATIDPIKARKSSRKYLQAYDVILLQNDLPDAIKLYNQPSLSRYYTRARRGHNFIKLYRDSKRKLRDIFRIKGHAGSLTK